MQQYILPYDPHYLTTELTSLYAQPWTFLLHSGGSKHTRSRFDILVADPTVTLVTHGMTTIVTTVSDQIHTHKNPFSLVKEYVTTSISKQKFHPDLPFQGGAVGLFSYDLIRRFEIVPQVAAIDIKHPTMAIGIYDWALIADHYHKRLSLIAHGNLWQRVAWLQRYQQRCHISISFRLNGSWHSNMSYENYVKKFSTIKTHLVLGDCYQVNLAQRFSAPYQGDEWQAFRHLNTINEAPFSAFLRYPWGVILSFSPEQFLQVKEGQISSNPIKGTRPRAINASDDALAINSLATSEKDRAENIMIVDLLRNDIGRVAIPGTVKVPLLCVVETFSSVHHLVSTIIAMLDPSYHPLDLLRKCFPGGSVTGAPKISAMKIIESLEPHRRQAYCGSIGYLSCCGTMDTNIAIRTLLANDGILYCWGGGGIVLDSEVEIEYQESLDKINHILLPLAKLNQ